MLQMAYECLLVREKLTSHKVIVNFDLAIFTRGNYELVIGWHSEVGAFLVCEAELVPYRFNLRQ